MEFATLSIENYDISHRIGEGTYSEVYSAVSKLSSERVALKKLHIFLNNSADTTHTTIEEYQLREIQALMLCREFIHCAKLIGVASEGIYLPDDAKQANKLFKRDPASSSSRRIPHLYLVLEHCDHDLETLLDKFGYPFSEAESKSLILQLFRALDFLHNRISLKHMQDSSSVTSSLASLAHISIIHRDIKMSNLLYTSTGVLKLADFGLARPLPMMRHDDGGSSSLHEMTPKVVSLWFRAPELLLGCPSFVVGVF
jgi:serine/threonine protein kinase